MANIKGITIQLDGDTTKLTAALKNVNKEIRSTQSDLREVEKLLKFDPGNADLLAQKQKELARAIDATKEKLAQEQEALKQLQEGPQNADTIKQQEALTREIESTKQSLEGLTSQYKSFGSLTLQQQEASIQKLNDHLKETKEKLTEVNAALKMDPGNTDLLAQKQKLLADAVETTKEKLKEEKAEMEALKNAPQTEETKKKQEELTVEISKTTSELKSLTKEYENFGSVSAQKVAAAGEKVQEVGDKMAGVGTKLTAGVTAPLVAGATAAVNAYGDVDKQFNLVRQTMGDTANSAEDFDGLWKQIGDSAKASVFGMQDAADACLNFARQGFTAKQATDMLTPAMDLAAGTGTDLSTVTAGLGNAMKMFGADSSEAANYADVLAKAQAQANTDTTQLFEAMSVAGPICKTVGWNIKDLATITDVFGNAGISGSEGANALKTGLARLASPAKSGAEAMDALGLSTGQTYAIFNDNGTLKDMPTVMQNLNSAFSGLTDQEKLEAAANIFGKNQMSKWLTLIQTSPSEVKGLRDGLDDVTGSANNMSTALMSGTGGTIEQLKSTFDVLTVTIGQAVAPAFQSLMEKIIDVMNAVMEMDPATQKLVLTIAAVAAAIGPVLIVIGKMATGVGAVMKLASQIVSTVSKVKTAMSGLFALMAANPITIVIAAIAALVAAFVILWNKSEAFRNFWKGLWEGIKTVVSGAVDGIKAFFDKIGDFFSEIGEKISAAYEGIRSGLESFISGIGEKVSGFFETVIGTVTDFFSGIGEKIGSFFSSAAEVVQAGWETVKNVVTVGIMLIQEVLSAAAQILLIPFQFIWENFGPVVQEAWEKIKGIVSAALDAIKNVISTVWTAIKGVIEPILEGIRSAVETAWNAISTVTGQVFQAVKNTLTTIWNGIKAVLTPIITAIQTAVTTAWNAICSVTSSVFNTVKNTLTTIWNGIKSVITTVVNGIKSVITTAWNAISSTTSTVWSAIKNVLTTIWNGIKSTITTVVNGIKSTVTSVWNAMKSTISSVMNGIKSTITSIWNGIKSTTSSVVNGMKSTVSSVFNSIKGTATSVWNGIKSAIVRPVEAARDAVRNAIDRMRSFFHFSWSLPRLKLPHLSISGHFSLDPPSVPHFSISWYKKAMEGGMVLNGATIFGAKGNQLLAGGEAGPEAVVGVKSLQGMIQSAVRSVQSGTNVGNITINVYGAPGQDVNELADVIEERINQKVSMRGAVFA